jgi:GT2 family glycosyltransferase
MSLKRPRRSCRSPLVSLIILNYNGGNVIIRCIESLIHQDFPEDLYEIIVVDNASQDGSADLIENMFHSVKVVRSASNRGYAGGANFGASYSQGDALVFLNNDVQLSADWLTNMVTVLQNEGSVLVGSKIFFEHRPDRLNHAGGLISCLGTGFDIGLGMPDRTPNKIVPVGYVSGAALMIPRQLFTELGGFDESYFLYCEDVDLCWRAWLRGYKVLLQPAATLFHGFQSSKSGSGYTLRFLHWHKNALVNIFKNFGVQMLLRGLALHIVLQIARVLSAIRWSSPWCIVMLIRADLWLVRNLRSTIMKRAAIQARRKTSDQELAKMNLFLPIRRTMPLGSRMFSVKET